MFEGYVGTVIDVDDRRRADMCREVVVRESSHRLKNAFSIVQSIASQTLRQAATIDEARVSLPARLLALASAQELLSHTENPAADVGAVIESAIAPYRTGEGQFVIDGPQANLAGQQAFGLVLAVHELATNAVKYGALSVAGGHVAMHWNTDPDGTFEFMWKETDGPPVSPPSRRGFGTRLVERATALYFDGTSSLEFDVTGVRFRLLGKLQSE